MRYAGSNGRAAEIHPLFSYTRAKLVKFQQNLKHLATGTAAAKQLPLVREYRHHSISLPQQLNCLVKLPRNIDRYIWQELCASQV